MSEHKHTRRLHELASQVLTESENIQGASSISSIMNSAERIQRLAKAVLTELAEEQFE